jgi:hypothetical protein
MAWCPKQEKQIMVTFSICFCCPGFAPNKQLPQLTSDPTNWNPLHIMMSCHQNAGKNYNIKIAIRSFENVAKFKYLGMTGTNQNLIYKEIKRILNSGNACYHSIQNLLSSHLQFKNIKIKIYRPLIFPVVLHGCETWSLILRKEYRLKVFKNRLLRRIF